MIECIADFQQAGFCLVKKAVQPFLYDGIRSGKLDPAFEFADHKIDLVKPRRIAFAF